MRLAHDGAIYVVRPTNPYLADGDLARAAEEGGNHPDSSEIAEMAALAPRRKQKRSPEAEPGAQKRAGQPAPSANVFTLGLLAGQLKLVSVTDQPIAPA